MTFLEFPIRRWQFTVVVFGLLIALGVGALVSIPRSEDPNFPITVFLISAVYPGADAVEMERLVAKPIEDRLNEIDDLKKIVTTVSDSVAIVNVEFESTVDAEKKYDEATREINAIRPSLPTGVAKVEIRKINPGLVNIVQLALVSDEASYRQLEDLARDLKDRLKGVSGVRQSEYWAVPKRELRVAVDLKRMASLGISTDQVSQALQAENASVPGGRIEIGSRSFSIKSSGNYENLDDVRNTIVRSAGGRMVKVGDIAEVTWTTQEQTYLGRFNGKRAVFVTANQKDNHNIFDTRKGIMRVVDDFTRDLPANVRLERGFDQAANVSARLNRLSIDLSIAIVLVAVTLLPLGFRAAGIVMISIPLSLAIGIAALDFAGFSLNQLSIAGFIVALGLLVDDSVVVVENIARHLREGQDRIAAAISGTRQIFIAILGCTVCLCLAFLPLMFLPGNAGKFIRSLPSAVLFTVIASLLVSLTIIPFLASRVFSPHGGGEGNRILQLVQRGIHRFYTPLLHAALGSPKKTMAVVMVLIALMAGGFLIVPKALFPKADTPQFMVSIKTPDGASLTETEKALQFVESRLAKDPEVTSYFSNLGNNNPKVYYNVIPLDEATNVADVFVQLKRYSTRETPAHLDALRQEFNGYLNAEIRIKEFENGPPLDAPIAVRVLGPDLGELSRLSAQIEQLIKSTPGARDVVNPLRLMRSDLKLKVNSQKLALLGVSRLDVNRAVRLAVSGSNAGGYKDPNGEQYDIIVRTPITARPSLEALQNVRVVNTAGASLPLTQLASIEFAASPTQITRYNRQRESTLTAYAANGYNTDQVTQVIRAKLDHFQWPRGYRYLLAGEIESREESLGGMGTAILIAIFGIFCVLVLEFGDFKSVLIVLTVIPLGAFGGLLALFVSGNALSFTATIGFIALIGIEIKNSILLVDFTNQLRESGMDLDTAIERGGEVRFLPILLTSATAIGGLMPLALQNSTFYSPMAWVIIGGLLSSTVLARIVTPVMYKLIPPTVNNYRITKELNAIQINN